MTASRARWVVPLVALLCGLPAHALEWPVEKKVLTGSFGETRGDHFHLGIDIGGGEQDVHPILPGELIFSYQENGGFTSLPRGVGSFVALQHADSIVSIYCHLKDLGFPAGRTQFSAADGIGIIGDSGHAAGKHLHLAVYDRETGLSINPLSVLPPIPDGQPPVIRSLSLKTGEAAEPIRDGALFPAGRAELLADVHDPREDVRFLWPLAPYSVRVALNGKEVFRITFDAFEVREGRTVIRGTGLGLKDVYTPDGLMRCGSVELHGGESHLLAAVRDFTGNETVKEMFLKVRE